MHKPKPILKLTYILKEVLNFIDMIMMYIKISTVNIK